MDRQPHNNLWAEKLLQVSMPDSGEAWAGMEAILDRELPQRFWSEKRRWLLLILLLLLLIGVCNCPGRGRLFHSSGNGASTTGAVPAPAQTLAGGKPASPASATSANPAAPVTSANPAAPGSRPATLATRHVRSGPLPPASGGARMRNRLVPADSTTRPALSVMPSGRPAPVVPHGSSGTMVPHGSSRIMAPHGSSRTAIPTAFGDVTQNARAGSPVAKTSVRRRPAAKGTGSKKMGTTMAGDDTTKGNVTAAGNTITRKNTTTPGDTAAKKNAPVLPKVVSRKDTSHKKPPPPREDDNQKEK